MMNLSGKTIYTKGDTIVAKVSGDWPFVKGTIKNIEQSDTEDIRITLQHEQLVITPGFEKGLLSPFQSSISRLQNRISTLVKANDYTTVALNALHDTSVSFNESLAHLMEDITTKENRSEEHSAEITGFIRDTTNWTL